MKFVSLVFDYNLKKMIDGGRIWGKEGYKNKEYIFEFSAASIATVLNKNPYTKYEIWTDNVNLLSEKISKYNVKTDNLFLLDKTTEIEKWMQHKYCFWPATMFYQQHGNEKFIKLDTDLTCFKNCDELFDWNGSLVWKFERNCSKGREYWGEKYAAKKAFGTDNFNIYNIGVFSISNKIKLSELVDLTQKVVDVDISSIVRFPEDPKMKTTMWSCGEQTAYCYFIDKYKIPVKETHEFFQHHCYVKTKEDCIERAKFLLK